MHTITIVAYRRPEYFKSLLRSLVANNLIGWKIFIQLDPSDKTREIIEITKEHLGSLEYDLQVNPTRQGVKLNPYNLLKRVFDQGSELNIHLEEDIIFSSDVTRVAEWYMTQNLKNILCLNLVATGCFSAAAVTSEDFQDSASIIKTKLFNSIGFVLTASQWMHYFKTNWLSTQVNLCNYDGVKVSGWDVAIYANLLNSYELFTLAPLMPRATHIGVKDGEYCLPDFQEKAWSGVQVCDDFKDNIHYNIIDRAMITDPKTLSLLNAWDEIHHCLKTIQCQNQILSYLNYIYNLMRKARKLKTLLKSKWF